MNAFWKVWWLLCHAEGGAKKDKLGLNSLLLIYWSKFFDCHVEYMFKCLKHEKFEERRNTC